MPIQVRVENNRIMFSIMKGSSVFREDVEVLKTYHSLYSPETHEWEVSPSKFNTIYDSLSDIDRFYIPEEEEKKIDALMTLPSQIKVTNYKLDVSTFKMPPMKGKPPYENYQTEDIETLYNTNRIALFNEQGTGKSYELITAADQLREKQGIKKILFITSSSGVYNIRREFFRFSNVNPEKITVGGINNRRCFSDSGIDVIIMNYRSFLLVSDEYKKENKTKKLKTKNYRKTGIPIKDWLNGDTGILILDESHNIANPKARQTQAIHLLAPYFENRILSTGTPADIEWKNYSQLKILDPALVRNLSYSNWLMEYFNLGDRFSSYSIKGIKPHKAIELSDLVKKHCIRRFADDVLNLPQQYVRKYYVEFSPIQKEIYQKIVKNKMEEIQQEFGNLNTRAVFNSFPYLMLAIDNPQLLLKHAENPKIPINLIDDFEFNKDHPKVQALIDIVDNHPKEKIVIWTSHPSVAGFLSGIFKNCLLINGESKVPKGMTLDQFKDSIVEKFQNMPECRILIASTQVMNSSITLVAANIQIVFDSTFNYTEYDQALSRVYRIGQDKPVFTYILLIDESLDVMRNKNLEQKDFVNNNFLKKDYIDLQTAKVLFNMKGE
jgi:SNF2 family DNA or RNA helicase